MASKTNSSGPNACSICDSEDTILFYEAPAVPTHVGVQWPTEEAARACPRGDIALVFCRRCGHIFNAAFNPELMAYTQAYDNSLHFSDRFQAYTDEVVERLVERYDLHGKTVVEIGCGKGDFLISLAQAGPNQGIGFDPSYEERPLDDDLSNRVTFVREFYSAESVSCRPDLICSRYVYEHIPKPIEFLTTIRNTVSDTDETVVYFEVPNVKFILRDLSVWDVIYEHCSFFSDSSLAYSFQKSDFEVIDLVEGYDGQFIGIEARPGRPNGRLSWGNLDELEAGVAAYAANHTTMLQHWRKRLSELEADGRKCVLWGAGAKAVSFLNMLGVHEGIEYVVDINPHKHGKHIAGTGQQIVAPEVLADYRPESVIVMNPIYRDEIRRMTEELGLAPEFLYAS